MVGVPPRQPVPERLALALPVPWAVWAVLRLAGAERGFPLVPALTFTPYAAATGVVPLGAALLARSRAATVLAAGATAALACPVLARARRQPTPTEGRRLRLVSFNMLHGRADAGALVDLVAGCDADVLTLMEVTPGGRDRLVAAGLRSLLPTEHTLLPADPTRLGAGGSVWTRLPVLGRSRVPGSFEQPQLRLALPGGPDVEVTAVHAHPPLQFAAGVRAWEEDLARLPAPGGDVVRVLAGDFNASGDHASFRRLLRRGWVDAARAAGQGLRATWSPTGSPQPRLTLDHVLVDPRVGVAGLRVVHLPGSDHRALVADLRVPAGAAVQHVDAGVEAAAPGGGSAPPPPGGCRAHAPDPTACTCLL
jgi:endonuclease/exonuclease/phosphatase (EEP) superfamily protein YafD